MRHFLDDALVEHALVEEDERIRGHEGHENAVEDAHPRVEEEEKHARKHDGASHHLSFACFRPPLPAGEDRQVVVREVVVDPLELYQGIDVLVDLCPLVPEAEGTVGRRETVFEVIFNLLDLVLNRVHILYNSSYN